MEAVLQLPGLLQQPLRFCIVAELPLDVGHGPAGPIAVGLHFAQGDRPLRQAPIGVVHAIVGILPALVAQTPLGGALVAQEAIGRAFLGGTDPGHRPVQGAVQLADEGLIAAAQQVVARQDQKQRRGIDAAVVVGKGHLPQGGHFPQPGLVQHLARFRIVGGVAMAGLVLRQKSQHATGQPRFKQQQLPGRDQAIAPKRTTEPGHPGVGVQTMVQLAGEQVHIRGGACDPAIEGGVVAAHAGGEPVGLAEAVHRRLQGRIKRRLRWGLLAVAIGMEIEHQAEPPRPSGLELQAHLQAGLIQLLHRSAQPHQGAAVGVVESAVYRFQPHGGAGAHGATALWPLVAPHLEDVAKVGVDVQRDRHLQRGLGVAGEGELLQAGRWGEHRAALEMHRFVVVAEVAHLQAQFAPFGGAQHRSRPAPQQPFQAAHMAGAPVKHPRVRMGVGVDLAAGIEHREGFPVLQHERGQHVMRHGAGGRGVGRDGAGGGGCPGRRGCPGRCACRSGGGRAVRTAPPGGSR